MYAVANMGHPFQFYWDLFGVKGWQLKFAGTPNLANTERDTRLEPRS
jgi:hypothetical protein